MRKGRRDRSKEFEKLLENFICTEASFRRIWAAADGVRFYYAADRTYLADSVPPEYLIKVERE